MSWERNSQHLFFGADICPLSGVDDCVVCLCGIQVVFAYHHIPVTTLVSLYLPMVKYIPLSMVKLGLMNAVYEQKLHEEKCAFCILRFSSDDICRFILEQTKASAPQSFLFCR